MGDQTLLIVYNDKNIPNSNWEFTDLLMSESEMGLLAFKVNGTLMSYAFIPCDVSFYAVLLLLYQSCSSMYGHVVSSVNS